MRDATSSAQGSDEVDLAQIRGAVAHLPAGSLLRRLVLSEPGKLSRPAFSAKAELWARIAFAEAEAVVDTEQARRGLPLVALAIERAAVAPKRTPPRAVETKRDAGQRSK